MNKLTINDDVQFKAANIKTYYYHVIEYFTMKFIQTAKMV